MDMAKFIESPERTAHECVSPQALRALLEQLLREVKTPREFAQNLARTAVGQCPRCSAALLDLAISRADLRRRRLSSYFATSEAPGIFEGLVGSSPQTWPPDSRWPEVEAFASTCESRSAESTVLLSVMARLVGEIERSTDRARQAQKARVALRDCLRARAEPVDLALAGLLCDNGSIEAEAYRRQSFQDETSPESSSGVWRRAERVLSPDDDEPRLESLCVPVGQRRDNVRKVTPRSAHRYGQAIEAATIHLKDLEASATRLCADTVARGYPFAAVSIVRLEDGVIESIAGCGEAARWVGRARHPIHAHVPLAAQDVQAHVVLTGHAELVFHHDTRLDPFLKSRFKHQLPRFFIPLAVAYDDKGHQINDACTWKPVPQKGGLLALDTPEGAVVRVFGTIEVGIIRRGDQSLARFIELANFITAEAGNVYRCTLGRVFDTVVTVIRALANANSATLHLGRKCGGEVRWYADHCFRRDALRAPCMLSPSGFAEGTVGGTPRPGGLGAEALAAGKPRTRSGADLEQTNPAIYREGIRSMTAFPLFVGNEVALVYVHHRQAIELDAQERFWINTVARRAAHNIRMTTAYLEERNLRTHINGQMSTMNDLFETAQSDPASVRGLITGGLLNISAADFVVLCSTRHDRVDLPEATWAGRLLADKRYQSFLAPLIQGVAGAAEPLLLGEEGLKTIISPACASATELALGRAAQFFEHEKVRSLAAVPLKGADDLSAVLLVCWRRPVELKQFEQRLLEFINSTVLLALEQAETTVSGNSLLVVAAMVEKVISSLSPRLTPDAFDEDPWKEPIHAGSRPLT
jgi:hypothetical protein